MLKIHTIRFKITISYVLILGLILSIYSALLGFSLHKILIHDLNARLSIKTQEITDLLNVLLTTSPSTSRKVRAASHQIILRQNLSYQQAMQDALQRKILKTVDEYDLRGDYVTLLDSEKHPITISENIPPELLNLMLSHTSKLSSKSPEHRVDLNHQGKMIRLLSRRIHLQDGETYFIQVGTSLTGIKKTHWRLFSVVLFLLPVSLLLASSVGQWLVGRILMPVMALTKTAEKITHEDLSARVQIQDADEEMRYLVNAFNEMIERLEHSFRHISDFSSHVAHELKTPLAVIRGESEIALRKERTPAEYQEALQANLREVRRMIRIIEDMLLLARLDYDPKGLDFKIFDFKAFLEEISEQAKILSEAKKIIIEVSLPSERLSLSGDEVHLRRLFLNLIDNAVKFSPEQSRLVLHAEKKAAQIQVSIADSGPGIPSQNLPKIFQQFFHHAPSGIPAGNGLGLSIALSIARAHGGSITACNLPSRGALFTVNLPLKD